MGWLDSMIDFGRRNPGMSRLPLAFFIGDSISVHYCEHIPALLAGRFRYARKTGRERAIRRPAVKKNASGQSSTLVLMYIEAMLAGGRWRPDLLVLNCGLHDISRNRATGKIATPLPQYRRNLQRILELLRKAGIRVVWVRTTPVDDARHHKYKTFDRRNADVRRYNAAADKIMTAAGVPIADLYGFTNAIGGAKLLRQDGVHFTQPARRAQAIFLAGFICGFWAGYAAQTSKSG